jgi:hypothetical protein
MLLQSGMKRSRALAILASVRGHGAVGNVHQRAYAMLAHYSRELMAVVIGIFMHISTTILFEASDLHRFNFAKLGAIALGTALGVASVIFTDNLAVRMERHFFEARCRRCRKNCAGSRAS